MARALYPTVPLLRVQRKRRLQALEQAEAGRLKYERNPAAAGARAGRRYSARRDLVSPQGPSTPFQPELMQSIVERGAPRVQVTPEGLVREPYSPGTQYGREALAGSLAPGGRVEGGRYVGSNVAGVTPTYAPSSVPWNLQRPASGGPSYAQLAAMTRARAPLGLGRQALAEQMPMPDEFMRADLQRQMLGAQASALPAQLAAETAQMQGRAALLGAQAEAAQQAGEMQGLVLEQVKRDPAGFVQAMTGATPVQQALALGDLAASMADINPEMAAQLSEYAAQIGAPGMPRPPKSWWDRFVTWFWANSPWPQEEPQAQRPASAAAD